MAAAVRAFIARHPIKANVVIYGTLFASGEVSQQTMQVGAM